MIFFTRFFNAVPREHVQLRTKPLEDTNAALSPGSVIRPFVDSATKNYCKISLVGTLTGMAPDNGKLEEEFNCLRRYLINVKSNSATSTHAWDEVLPTWIQDLSSNPGDRPIPLAIGGTVFCTAMLLRMQQKENEEEDIDIYATRWILRAEFVCRLHAGDEEFTVSDENMREMLTTGALTAKGAYHALVNRSEDE
ncbi:hypothetical protein C8F01DRAFT_1092001 [Mycena amicta]|nr:hypothetical protein C8F01DRAFT_1092001 [Mycena amicta]